MMMLSSKKFNKMARKWLDIAAAGRTRNSSQTSNSHKNAYSFKESCKGHFVVYSSDWKRFEIPLPYLRNSIFQELLKMSEEEFGLPSEGPIRIPCDSVLIQHIIFIIKKGLTKELEKVLLNHVPVSSYSSCPSLHSRHLRRQLLVHGY